jgi:hypothetical protein
LPEAEKYSKKKERKKERESYITYAIKCNITCPGR